MNKNIFNGFMLVFMAAAVFSCAPIAPRAFGDDYGIYPNVYGSSYAYGDFIPFYSQIYRQDIYDRGRWKHHHRHHSSNTDYKQHRGHSFHGHSFHAGRHMGGFRR